MYATSRPIGAFGDFPQERTMSALPAPGTPVNAQPMPSDPQAQQRPDDAWRNAMHTAARQQLLNMLQGGQLNPATLPSTLPHGIYQWLTGQGITGLTAPTQGYRPPQGQAASMLGNDWLTGYRTAHPLG